MRNDECLRSIEIARRELTEKNVWTNIGSAEVDNDRYLHQLIVRFYSCNNECRRRIK